MEEITVIIPCYNMPDKVVMAIQSALVQECNLRVVVVDDGSTPALKLPIEIDSNPNFKILRHKQNKGAAAARSTGVSGCKTPWITFLDADDLMIENTLQKRLEAAQNYFDDNGSLSVKEIGAKTIFSCGWRELDAAGKPRFLRTPKPASTAEEFASGCWWNPGSTTLGRKEVFENFGFKTDQDIRRLEDFDWSIRFGMGGGRLVIYKGVGVVVKPSLRAELGAIENSVSTIRGFYQPLASTHPFLWKRINAYLELELFTSKMRFKKYWEASTHLLRSYLFKPRIKRHLSPGWNYKKLK